LAGDLALAQAENAGHRVDLLRELRLQVGFKPAGGPAVSQLPSDPVGGPPTGHRHQNAAQAFFGPVAGPTIIWTKTYAKRNLVSPADASGAIDGASKATAREQS
jgi:hypothetical protein